MRLKALFPLLSLLFLLAVIAFAGCGGFGDGRQRHCQDDDFDFIPGDDDDDTEGEGDELGITWATIPAGEFSMGCSEGDADCRDDELPAHVVTIDAFEMANKEITQALYAEIMGVNPSDNVCATCPAEQVTWDQAAEFCAAVDARLPTEAEWEYAARAGSDAIYPCGGDAECLADSAWYLDNASGASHPVGEKSANAFGLYDVLGNVAEWTADWYGADYYESSPAAEPQGPDASQWRVIRGGGYNNAAEYLRVSYRNYDPPDDLSRLVGFRCARNTTDSNGEGDER